jgi:hypothetical protein
VRRYSTTFWVCMAFALAAAVSSVSPTLNGREIARDYHRALKPIITVPCDFSKPGVYDLEFDVTYRFAHAVRMSLADPRPQSELWIDLDELAVNVEVLESPHGAQEPWNCDGYHHVYGPLGSASDFFTFGHGACGHYKIRVEVLKAQAELAGLPQVLAASSLVCGCEGMVMVMDYALAGGLNLAALCFVGVGIAKRRRKEPDPRQG